VQMPTVPDSVDRAAVEAGLQSMGIDPTYLLTATVRPRTIELEYAARNEAGQKFAAGNELATVRVTVPIAKRADV
jgi:hypothetical protein